MIGGRKPTLFEKAVVFRKNGYSFGMIREELGVAKGTLSFWLRDIPIEKISRKAQQRVKSARVKSSQTKQLKQSREIREMREKGIKEVEEISKRKFWLAGVALYWAEGAKAFENVALTNADPETIRFYIKWLKECCHVKSYDLRLSLHIYPDVQPEEAEQYWSAVSGIPLNQFYKIQIDSRNKKREFKKGRCPYGTVQVRLMGKGTRRLHRLITGWIEGLKICGGSSMAECGPSKSDTRVRFPSPAQKFAMANFCPKNE